MFDIGASEFLLIVVVAVIAIGPKDLPLALRTAGRWVGKMRRMSNHFRAGIENMIREAELEEMEKKWREQNAAIMAEHPPADAAAEQALVEGGVTSAPAVSAADSESDSVATAETSEKAEDRLTPP